MYSCRYTTGPRAVSEEEINIIWNYLQYDVTMVHPFYITIFSRPIANQKQNVSLLLKSQLKLEYSSVNKCKGVVFNVNIPFVVKSMKFKWWIQNNPEKSQLVFWQHHSSTLFHVTYIINVQMLYNKIKQFSKISHDEINH